MSDLTDAEIDEMIGDGTCTHLPQVRMALEIRRLRLVVGLSEDERLAVQMTLASSSNKTSIREATDSVLRRVIEGCK